MYKQWFSNNGYNVHIIYDIQIGRMANYRWQRTVDTAEIRNVFARFKLLDVTRKYGVDASKIEGGKNCEIVVVIIFLLLDKILEWLIRHKTYLHVKKITHQDLYDVFKRFKLEQFRDLNAFRTALLTRWPLWVSFH